MGIKKIKGRVITDDSYYDFLPVPAKWLCEDEGNYYGSGVYGLSAFDNTYEIHLKTLSGSSLPSIMEFTPKECSFGFSNFLVASDTSEKGCVYASPYSTTGWLAGKIPVNQNDYVLKASITDPPLLVAKMMTDKLKARSIKVFWNPTTIRLEKKYSAEKIIPITETLSPLLTDIIEVLNHESVNLYAEHLIKELGKKFRNNGSTASGIEVIIEFLKKSGINTNGLFIVDGSGLSPQNAINTGEVVKLLIYMKTKGKYFPSYYSSFPDAGKNGTMKSCFKDSLFDSRLKAKSGSMTRVQSFAGYFTTISGKNMAFSIIINNYTGPSKNIISGIEEIIGELISNN
jgi:D-alanyl-D-alanine carboxypeptidase/D-alanyl-D-alanine-endopeptidase (penicillin-binding protein 4)